MVIVMSPALVCTSISFLQPRSLVSKTLFSRNNRHHQYVRLYQGINTAAREKSKNWGSLVRRKNGGELVTSTKKGPDDEKKYESVRNMVQSVLWGAEAVYILWLFLLPYAPGDPVWTISPDTISSLVGLSLNFFLILPFLNAGRVVGINLIEAPVLHPMSEGLFNFVIGWTFMFAPLLFTDCKRDRYKGSLDVLWGFQMFLTNTFLIPYMAIRLNEQDENISSRKLSKLGSVMTKGAPIVGVVGGAVCLISMLWALYGRMEGSFGNITERWDFLLSYLGSERLAYAFIWDICLYTIFQPWLIGENLQNVKQGKIVLVKYLRFVPVVGLVVYLLYLNLEEEHNCEVN